VINARIANKSLTLLAHPAGAQQANVAVCIAIAIAAGRTTCYRGFFAVRADLLGGVADLLERRVEEANPVFIVRGEFAQRCLVLGMHRHAVELLVAARSPVRSVDFARVQQTKNMPCFVEDNGQQAQLSVACRVGRSPLVPLRIEIDIRLGDVPGSVHSLLVDDVRYRSRVRFGSSLLPILEHELDRVLTVSRLGTCSRHIEQLGRPCCAIWCRPRREGVLDGRDCARFIEPLW
jgi:hypothetical protein